MTKYSFVTTHGTGGRAVLHNTLTAEEVIKGLLTANPTWEFKSITVNGKRYTNITR